MVREQDLVSVYHVTRIDVLDQILEEGLVPKRVSSPTSKIIPLEEIFDLYAPVDVSRRKSVFAFPERRIPSPWSWAPIILQLFVNPTTALVTCMELYTEASS